MEAKLAAVAHISAEIFGMMCAFLMLVILLGVCGIAMGSGDILTELIRSIF